MTTLSLYLLKVTETCNLNCKYCYMFNLRDFVHLAKPKLMPMEVVARTARSVVRSGLAQGVGRITVAFHGGEPTLAGRAWIGSAIDLFRREASDRIEVEFGMQTNGILIDRAWTELLSEHRIKVGMSLDGPPEINDRARVDRKGRGSYRDAVRGLHYLQDLGELFGGVICVINPGDNGLSIYRHFLELGIRSMDFVWPLDYNWDHPPHRESADETPFADYLIPIFDEWWNAGDPSIHIRYFGEVLKALAGRRASLDSVGGDPLTIVSIDTDGSIEPVDSLKACGHGFTDLHLNVMRDEVEAILSAELFKEALLGRSGLCEDCRRCAFVDTCGGGYLPHRYSQRRRFENPSVYCRDIWRVVSHILGAAQASLVAGATTASTVSSGSQGPVCEDGLCTEPTPA